MPEARGERSMCMNDVSTVRQFPDPPADEAYHGLADDVVRVKRVPPVVLTGNGRLNQQPGSSKKEKSVWERNIHRSS